MGVYSGTFGFVNGKSSIRNWTLNETMTLARVVGSNTAGGSDRRKGIKDMTGQMTGWGPQPPVMPGETFAFTGYTAPTSGIEGEAGTNYIVAGVMVNSVTINWNWATGEPVNWSVDFGNSSSTDLIKTSAISADAGDIVARALCGVTGPSMSATEGGVVDTEIENVTTAVLTLTRDNTVAANSSTNNLMVRKIGPLDWTLALTIEDDDMRILVPGDRRKFSIPVDGSDEWVLWWGQVRDFTNLTVDRETGAIINYTMNIDMAGYDTAGTAEGKIVLPDDTLYWGTA